MAFATAAFDAELIERPIRREGKFAQATLRIGAETVMVGLTAEGKGMPAMAHLYLDDPDASFAAAVAAGGEAVLAPANQPYGDRAGSVRDPGGNIWWIAGFGEIAPLDGVAARLAAKR
ncbi:MAG: VOC family protein [Pseudomonadota bacterium]